MIPSDLSKLHTYTVHNSNKANSGPQWNLTISVVPCRRNTTYKCQHTFQIPCKALQHDSSHCNKCPEERIHINCLSSVKPRGSTSTVHGNKTIVSTDTDANPKKPCQLWTPKTAALRIAGEEACHNIKRHSSRHS